MASENVPSSEKEAMETPPEGYEHPKPSVSCQECGHSTQAISGMKLHVKNKHSISQVDGNTSLVDIIEEEAFEKHFSFKRLCNYG